MHFLGNVSSRRRTSLHQLPSNPLNLLKDATKAREPVEAHLPPRLVSMVPLDRIGWRLPVSLGFKQRVFHILSCAIDANFPSVHAVIASQHVLAPSPAREFSKLRRITRWAAMSTPSLYFLTCR
jgi:hypothetical protein